MQLNRSQSTLPGDRADLIDGMIDEHTHRFDAGGQCRHDFRCNGRRDDARALHVKVQPDRVDPGTRDGLSRCDIANSANFGPHKNQRLQVAEFGAVADAASIGESREPNPKNDFARHNISERRRKLRRQRMPHSIGQTVSIAVPDCGYPSSLSCQPCGHDAMLARRVFDQSRRFEYVGLLDQITNSHRLFRRELDEQHASGGQMPAGFRN